MDALPTITDHHQGETGAKLRQQVSRFFHGTSILSSNPSKPENRRGSSRSRQLWSRLSRQPRHVHIPYHRHWPDATLPRSPTSTRSIIDPQSTPVSSASPFPQMPWPIESASTGDSRPTAPQRKWSSKLLVPKLRMPTSSFKSTNFRAKLKNKVVKRKALVCLASGVILAILLIICSPSRLPPIYTLH